MRQNLFSALSLLLLHTGAATPFEENELRYSGRFDMTREYPSADWSGSSITFFVNTSVAASEETQEFVDVSLAANVGAVSGSDAMLYFVGVLIDCELLDIYEVSSVNNIIQFSFPATAVHEIGIIKLTEGAYADSQGELALTSYTLSTNAHLLPQDVTLNTPQTCNNPNNLNLLVIGDSLSAAYGVDGVSPCSYSATTQNFLHSYAYLTADALGAALNTIAWSGKGVVRNYGDNNPTSPNPMPMYYNRTLAPLSTNDGSNYWNTSRYTPDVVLVMLGSNDYSTQPNPSDEDFTNGLVDLITRIRQDYPLALLAAMCAPSNNGNQCTNIENATHLTSSTFVSMDSVEYVYPNGCDGHPSIQTQQNIADVVIAAVQDMLRSAKRLH